MRGPVPPIQVYIHIGSHRLGETVVNHFNGPYRGADRVWHLSEGHPLETLCGSPGVDRFCV